MRVVVTGAGGFIGRRLCEEFKSRGDEVIALSRDAATARSGNPSVGQIHSWNPLAELAPAEAFEGVDAVVHLAGESVVGRWTEQKKAAIRDSRVVGTTNLVKGIARLATKPRVLVSASAIGYYGDRGDEDLTETAAPGNDFLADTCQMWEKEASKVEWLGVRSARVRIGIVLGAGGGALQAMLMPAKLGFGGPLGSGRQWWSWIHRDDLISLFLHLIEHEDFSGVVNGTTPEPARQKDFAKALGRVLHRPAFLPAPAAVLRILLGEFSTELLSSKRVLPAATKATGFRYRFPGLEDALRQSISGRH